MSNERRLRLVLQGGVSGPTLYHQHGDSATIRAKLLGESMYPADRHKHPEERKVVDIIFYDEDPFLNVADCWPRKGDYVVSLHAGETLGHVVDVEDAIVTYERNDVAKSRDTFIWVFPGGELNKNHTWKSRRDAGREYA